MPFSDFSRWHRMAQTRSIWWASCPPTIVKQVKRSWNCRLFATRVLRTLPLTPASAFPPKTTQSSHVLISLVCHYAVGIALLRTCLFPPKREQYGRDESGQNRPEHAKPNWNVNISAARGPTEMVHLSKFAEFYKEHIRALCSSLLLLFHCLTWKNNEDRKNQNSKNMQKTCKHFGNGNYVYNAWDSGPGTVVSVACYDHTQGWVYWNQQCSL